MSNHDPAVIRAAAYQQEKARLDRKTRTKAVQCEAPNRRCGSRCIPPQWDCRLKGEGNDPHLRALGKGSDPVSGLANIERGLGRFRTAAIKLSFSELEGGRKAIARGTAKLSPGDLKRKQEIKERTDFFLGRVVLPVAAIIGAGLLHKGLKNFRGYREGVGQQVDDSARNAILSIKENIPIYGQVVRSRRQAGREAVATTTRVINNFNTTGPESLYTNAGQRRTLSQMVRNLPSLNNEGFSAASRDLLDTSIRKVDGPKSRPSRLDYTDWHTKSLESFWSTETSAAVLPAGITRKSNLFSLHATNDLLSKSFGLQAPTGGNLKLEGEEVLGRMRQFFKTTGDSIRTGMREEGLDFKNPDTVRTYIGRNQAGTAVDERATQVLVNTVIRTDYETQARTLYRDTLSSYDQLFRKVSEDLSQAPSIDLVQNRGSASERAALQERRRNSYFNDAVEAHSSYLGQRLNLRAPVYGSYTGIVARRAYYTRFVAGSRHLPNNNAIAISLSRTEAFNAGIEIAKATGTPEPKTVEAALDLVVRTYGRGSGLEQGPYGGYAIGQIGLITGSTRRPVPPRPATPTETPRSTRPRRSTQESDGSLGLGRLIAELMKEKDQNGKPKYTLESATAEAKRIRSEQNKQDAQTDAYEMTRNDYTPINERKGQPCGKGFIGRQEKCSKPTRSRYADKPESSLGLNGLRQQIPNTAANKQTSVARKKPSKSLEDRVKEIGTAAAITGAGAAVVLLGAKRAKISQYRKNVAKSAVEAEKLSFEFERQFRDQAANRLKKRREDVTGYEASVYNFKDKGRDGGFGSMDNTPAWFGQTKGSKGAVVLLSYADDNKFTTRGQGSFMMADRGAFKEIWGDRDILPYSNNISQPTQKAPDDLEVRQQEEFLNKAERAAGPIGRNVTKAAVTMKSTVSRFGFLRQNVNERGFNPDAVRAAAFVVAQRRLTGKSVDIMSYSNGGNVATETLAILKEMGYRDVKVVNIAGPTFGIFEHSPDNMRTWVSRGDNFYTASRGLAFQGGNTRILDNDNIPHGLNEKIDPNNREFGKEARANFEAKNSYLLDEQLRKEAYKFLNVDRKRSSELLDETIWRISEKKPMEGDLAALYGEQSEAKLTEYSKLLENAGKRRDEVKSRIQDEIEDRMLDKWYGGYNPKAVKRAQKSIRAELETQTTPAKRKPAVRPMSINQLATNLMKQNPGMSRAAALRQARQEIAERKEGRTDNYITAFTHTLELYSRAM